MDIFSKKINEIVSSHLRSRVFLLSFLIGLQRPLMKLIVNRCHITLDMMLRNTWLHPVCLHQNTPVSHVDTLIDA